jgi:hypothetical protein
LEAEKEAFVFKRVLRYIAQHPEGLTSAQMQAWAASVRLHDIEWFDVDAVLRQLRDAGAVACANTLWYVREKRAKYL